MPCFAASAPQVTGTMVKTVDAIHDENGEVQLLHEEDTVVVDAEGRQHVIHDADYQATDAEGHVATKHVHADTVRLQRLRPWTQCLEC